MTRLERGGQNKQTKWKTFDDPKRGQEMALEQASDQVFVDQPTSQATVTVNSWGALASVVSNTRATHYRYRSFHATTRSWLEDGRFFPALANPSTTQRPSVLSGLWRVSFYRVEGKDGIDKVGVPLRAPGGMPLDIVVSLNNGLPAPTLVTARHAGGSQEPGGLSPTYYGQASGAALGAGMFMQMVNSHTDSIKANTTLTLQVMRERDELLKLAIAEKNEEIKLLRKSKKKWRKRAVDADVHAGGITSVIGQALQENPEYLLEMFKLLVSVIPPAALERIVRARRKKQPEDEEPEPSASSEPSAKSADLLA
jgi:hypothetical protein